MTQLQNIIIPQPCHQQWQQMTPVNEGRHCLQCSKTVTDFTMMDNNEIIAYLSANSHVCGRLEPGQLRSVNNQLYMEHPPVKAKLKGWAMVMALLSPGIFFQACGQGKAPTEQSVLNAVKNWTPEGATLGKIAAPAFREITGHVRDGKDPLPGVIVSVSNGLTATTDSLGNFSLRVPLQVTEFTINFIGYDRMTVHIDPNVANYEVNLVNSKMMMGEVVVVKQPFVKRVYHRYVRQPFRKIFK